MRAVGTGVLLCAVLSATLLPDLAVAQDSAGDPTISAKLVDYIQKKSWDAFVTELQREDMDANQPSPTGKLPLCEAVKTRELKYVDALIQHGVTVSVKEPYTGASPILIAFQNNLPDIARMLLAYGADPEAQAKNGKSAEDVASSAAIKDLLDRWIKDGPMAFEDKPGTWVKATSATHDQSEYWYNKDTQEGRWNLPPSCSWQRVEHQDAHALYVNYVTGQTVYKPPPPLCWRKLRVDGQEMWYNYAANISVTGVPDELPEYLAQEFAKSVNVRWYNKVTGEYSWEDPKVSTHWRQITSDDGPFYYNINTGESQWDVPDELAWEKHDDDGGKSYWFNKNTQASQWDEPEHNAWEKQDSEL